MRPVDKEKRWLFRDRGEQFWRAMQLLLDGADDYRDAIACLAVHSAISLADAVFALELGSRSTEDHGKAVGELAKLAAARKLPESGVKHFRWLLNHKSDFEYGESRLDVDKHIKVAALKADSFAAWVFQSFPELAREAKT